MIGPFNPFRRLRAQARTAIAATGETVAQAAGEAAARLQRETLRKASASAVMDLNFALWRMGFEAQSVIAMRAMGAAGLWNSSTSENQIMVREKQKAFARGAAQATLAMWRGADPAAVMLEAVKPLKARTGANARRLTKKGPRMPGASR